jgi:hypothetical protein
MKLPRWLIVCLLAASAAVAIFSAAWWWITWPSQSIRDFTSLLEHRRFEEADRLLRRPARLTVETLGGTDFVNFDSGEPNPAKGSMYSPDLWRSWCTLENLEFEPRSFSDVVAGRQAFSYHRTFTTPVYIGGSAERGTIILRSEDWAAPF